VTTTLPLVRAVNDSHGARTTSAASPATVTQIDPAAHETVVRPAAPRHDQARSRRRHRRDAAPAPSFVRRDAHDNNHRPHWIALMMQGLLEASPE
jgi:hypothetical protein